MATGWDRIVMGYEATISYLTASMLKHPDHSPDPRQYYVDHAQGMLQVVPLLRVNPLLANFQPPPYTSHDTLTFSTVDRINRMGVWCNVEDRAYGVRIVRAGKTVLESTATVENIGVTVQQYIEHLLQ